MRVRSHLVVWTAVTALAGCASAAGQPAATPHGVVRGTVGSAPTCPVERLSRPCPPRPVAGAAVVALRHGEVVASTTTGRAGRFRLTLAAGAYTIRATNAGPLATTASRHVEVTSGSLTRLRLVVDSGIR